MKFIISPTKTMVPYLHTEQTVPLLNHVEVLNYLKTFTVDEIQKVMKVNDSIAQLNYERYQNFVENGTALFTYTGLQYKKLDIQTLSVEDLAFAQDHVYVLSAFYGILRPFDVIGSYRIDPQMKLKINNKSISNYWKTQIVDILKDELIISLASKEYETLLDDDLNVIHIQFLIEKNGKTMTQATYAKMARGLFLRECILQKIQTTSELKKIEIDEFYYHFELSDEKTYVFMKKIK